MSAKKQCYAETSPCASQSCSAMLTVMQRRLLSLCLLLVAVCLLSGCWLFAPPTARFTMSPIAGTSPLLVLFDAAASSAGAADIVEYFWSFGDGTTGASRKMSHLYETDTERKFTATLMVTDRDGRQSTATKTVTVHPRVLPTEPPNDPLVSVEFVWPFNYDATGEDAAHLNDEYFTLQNTGEVVVDMTGWTVESEGGDRYQFPDGFVLSVGAFVTVHSGAGVDSYGILYWNAAGPVWNNDYDIAVLSDAAGDIVDVYAYASCFRIDNGKLLANLECSSDLLSEAPVGVGS